MKNRWYYTTTIVDEETGEILKQSQLDKKEYYIIKKEKVEKYNQKISRVGISGTVEERYNLCERTWICRRNNQISLFG